jgi:uncharacterized membrane protein YdbT with pleckstrin-like domain
MAQTKRKRTRKHRGNAAGIVERPAHNTRGAGAATSKRPGTREEQRAEARQRRLDRMNRQPTWKGAVQRAAIAAGLFAVLVTIFFKEKVVNSLAIAAFMLVVYIPLSYATDRALYNWRQKKKAAGQG